LEERKLNFGNSNVEEIVLEDTGIIAAEHIPYVQGSYQKDGEPANARPS
jgi:hypothetical protein